MQWPLTVTITIPLTVTITIPLSFAHTNSWAFL
jgi:hypothetical protein